MTRPPATTTGGDYRTRRRGPTLTGGGDRLPDWDWSVVDEPPPPPPYVQERADRIATVVVILLIVAVAVAVAVRVVGRTS